MAVVNNSINAPIPFTVPKGGTGNTTFTAFSVICAGTTATGAFQNVVGLGNLGQVLTSAGPGAIPTWTNAPGTGTVNSGTAGELAYYAASTNVVSGNANATISGGALTLGIATSVLGSLVLSGSTSGTVTIQPQAAAGGYNFNLPIVSGSAGQILQSGGGGATAMTWSTPTYPSASGTVGKILRSDGTNNVYSTSTFADTYTASNLLYSNGANTVQGLATANDGVLITSGAGVPSISTTLPTGLTIPGYAKSGANSDITSMSGLTGKLEAPTAIADISGNNILGFSYAVSGVNYINIRNSATLGQPRIEATGTDASVSMSLLTKNGNFNLQDGANTIAPTLKFFNAAGSFNTGLKVADAQASGLTLTLPALDAAVANAPLVSNAAGVLSFLTLAAITKVVTQVFTTNGTYTPTTGMKYCIIECVGGGGAGGGAAAAGAGAGTGGGGGGGGSYAKLTATAATIGVSQTVTIGVGGTVGTAGNNPGNNGGDTSVGVLCIGKGGTGGGGSAAAPGGNSGQGGVAGTGDIKIPGGQGDMGQYAGVVSVMPRSGRGGSSQFGTGGYAVCANAASTGTQGSLYGGGGSGGISYNNTGSVTGGAGNNGIVIITEFISV